MIESLRKAQQQALLTMLNLNQEPEDDAQVGWKVLVYDKQGQDVISPTLRLGDLRGAGITVHMALLSDRQPIPDVPAVYFIQPTIENIQILSEDLKKQLYSSVYVNFSSALPRSLLEEFASLTVQTNSASLVSQVYDQYLNYICLESNLFSLEKSQTYKVLNDPTTPDIVIEQLVDDIAMGLFSVIVTLGTVPIIKCQKGNVAEAVAKKLDSKLRDNIINSRANLFAEKMHLTRPVLILLDRSLDLASMLTHSWTYSTLFHDILEMKLNRVNVTADENGRKSVKNYDIDVTDTFWEKNASCPLPEVGMYIDTETKSYQAQVNSVGAADSQDPNDLNLSTQQLSSTIAQIPELRMKKKILDMHTVIATSLLNSIVQRQLDSFISMEESINKLTPNAILELISDQQKNIEDKLRLFLIYFLSVENVSKEDVTKIQNAFAELGCDVGAIEHVKHVRMYSKMTASQVANPQLQKDNSSNDLLGSFTSNFSRLTGTLQSAGIGEGFGNLISGVKNMLPSRKELTVTKIVDSVMEGTASSSTEDLQTFDPKSPRQQQSQQGAKKTTFSDAIVFVIGGGNYQEYHNLMDYAQVYFISY
ncbi:Sec1-like protein [Globomyces pollinis-pini]|nr:Sec1-like protein [Globomyces pollinis-pini]